MPVSSSRLPLAITYMMVMGALWGLQFSLAKTGARHGIAPAAWMLFVNGVGAPVLLAIAAWRGCPPRLLRPANP